MTTVTSELPRLDTPASWKAVSAHVDLGASGTVHYVDFGGPGQPGQAPLMLVHGLGGSFVNWASLGPLLAVHRRVFALDLPGFGLSYPNGRSASVTSNAAALAAFIDRVVGATPVLIGNSMGGLLSIMYASRQPTAGVVLIDPVLFRVPGQPFDREIVKTFATYAMPGLGTRLLARERRQTAPVDLVTRVFDVVSRDRSTIAADLFETSVAMATTRREAPGIDKAYLQAARSILRIAAKSKAYYAAMRRIDAPVLLIHGAHDRLVPVVAARGVAQRFPDWAYAELPDAGHVPHMEAAADVHRITTSWLAGLDR